MPRTKKRETFSKQKSIAIQTDDTDSNNEIVRLHEQLKMLQLENDTLRKRVDGNIPSAKGISDKTQVESVMSPRRINKISKGDPQILKSATKQKACTCKGNCSNRCGCVKNERKCGPTCKCDAQICQNQEVENKENMGDTQNEIIHEAQKLENEHFKGKTEYQNLFSPEGIENETNLDNIQFQEICFDTTKKLTYASDEELESEDKVEIKHDIIKRRKKDQKEHEGIADKRRGTTSRKQIIKIKVEKTNANGNNKKIAQETSKIESGVKQKSPLTEDEKKSISEADTSFDPMKPKRQLPRTPPHGNIEPDLSVSINHEISAEKIEQRIDTIPEELNQENVDLDKLSIELVSCNRCKRKFYPWRIVVHESACLGL